MCVVCYVLCRSSFIKKAITEVVAISIPTRSVALHFRTLSLRPAFVMPSFADSHGYICACMYGVYVLCDVPQVTIMQHTMEMQKKAAQDCMTPEEHIFMLPSDTRLDKETIETIIKSGRCSRVTKGYF